MTVNVVQGDFGLGLAFIDDFLHRFVFALHLSDVAVDDGLTWVTQMTLKPRS